MSKGKKKGNYKIDVQDFTPDEYENLANKPKHSNFFITINTNRVVKSKKDPLVENLYNALTEWFNNIGDFITTTEGYPENDERDVKIKRIIEKGPDKGLLHAHINIEITHHSNIQLDIPETRRFFIEELDLNGIHMDVKVYKKSRLSDEDRILRYMLKDV